MAALPLEGIRILDFTVVWAGPFASMMLADMGAEVIRVENTHAFQGGARGSMSRPAKAWAMSLPPWLGGYPDWEPGKKPWNRYAWFNGYARNHLSVTINQKVPRGKELFNRLVKKSDAVIENNVTETMEKLGVTYDVLKEVKPDIIYCRMPAYGNTGARKNYRSLGSHIEASVGHSALRHYPDTDPSTNTVTYLGDYSASNAAFAILCALHYRNRTGKGQLIEFAQSENVLSCFSESLMDYSMNQRLHDPIGNRDIHGAAPCGCYLCQGAELSLDLVPGTDNWINITVTSDEEWQGLRRAMGNPEWAKDERFSDSLGRWQNQDELDKRISEWTADKDKYELMYLLQKEGVPAGPVMDDRDCYNDPHLKARGAFEEDHHPEAGSHLIPGMMCKFSKTPLSVRTPAPLLGEHNEYVYKQIMGVSDEEYAELEKEGHIGIDYDPSIR